MTNNKSIQILRGTSANIVAANTTTNLSAGQPLYNTDKNYLTIGTEDGDSLTKKPIACREVVWYSGDTETIGSTTQRIGSLQYNSAGGNIDLTGSTSTGINIWSSSDVGVRGSAITVGTTAYSVLSASTSQVDIGTSLYPVNVQGYPLNLNSLKDINMQASGFVNINASSNININATKTVDIFGNSGLNIKSNGVINIATTLASQNIRLYSYAGIELYSTSTIRLNIGSMGTADLTSIGCFHVYTNSSFVSASNMAFKISACTSTTNISYKLNEIVLGRAGTNYTIDLPYANCTMGRKSYMHVVHLMDASANINCYFSLIYPSMSGISQWNAISGLFGIKYPATGTYRTNHIYAISVESGNDVRVYYGNTSKVLNSNYSYSVNVASLFST